MSELEVNQEKSEGHSSEIRPQLSAPRKLVMGVTFAVFLILCAEAVLRLLGFPDGSFRGAFATPNGLWEPGFTGENRAGPVPYRIQANAHGFRGPELRTGVDSARIRIVAIGDSMTDGFYVDNDATYPHLLNETLSERGYDVEVINAARGGGSIDRFHTILRSIATRLSPDLVIVTFVTNDLMDLGRFNFPITPKDVVVNEAASFFVSETAIGEGLMHLYLKLRSPYYKPSPSAVKAVLDDGRYKLEGGDRFEENARIFLTRFALSDGLLLQEKLTPKVEENFAAYFEHLNGFLKTAKEHGIDVLFVYIPAYPELYLRDIPTTTRDKVRAKAGELGVKYLDLTEALTRGSRDGPLHLAPLDFHMNPRGNLVMAKAIAERLVELGLP